MTKLVEFLMRMRWLAALLVIVGVAVCGTEVRAASFAIFQTAQSGPSVSCNIITGAVTGTGTGPCTTGATCDGVADASPAFLAFNTWALAWQAAPNTGQIELYIPPGSVCLFSSSDGARFPYNIARLLVSGYGATITNGGSGSGFALGGDGAPTSSCCSARVATVSAGSSFVTLLTPSQFNRFVVGQWALITGFDLQGYGYPMNPHFFEYVLVTAIDSNPVSPTYGKVSFASPLAYTYLSTWPLYQPGSVGPDFPDEGGPATLYFYPTSWNTEAEYRGLTISQTDRVTYAKGRSMTFRDVTVIGPYCIDPTENQAISFINSDLSTCSIEADKLTGEIVLDTVTLFAMAFQSSSINILTVTNSTVDTFDGTPKVANIHDSVVSTLKIGATSYGRSDSTTCVNCTVAAFVPGGIVDKGAGSAGINQPPITMSGGIITVPGGPVSWAVPGTNIFWAGGFDAETIFQIVDVTYDGTNTYVQTSMSGGFPSVPLAGGTALYVHVHPAPQFTCTNCTGGVEALDFSHAPAGAPLYSYSQRTYDKTTLTGSTPGGVLWGNPASISFNVTQAFAGTQNPLTFAPSPFANVKTLGPPPTYTLTDWGAALNLRVAANRVITLSGVTGGQASDCSGAGTGCLALPNSTQSWLVGALTPTISADVSGDPSNFSITVTVQTDQGVVIP